MKTSLIFCDVNLFIYLFIKLRPSITYKEKEKEEEAKKKQKTKNKKKQQQKQTEKQNKMARGATTAQPITAAPLDIIKRQNYTIYINLNLVQGA